MNPSGDLAEVSIPIRSHPQSVQKVPDNATRNPSTPTRADLDSYPAIADIPQRVTCHVPLRITPSGIPSAGRGIIVLEDVAAGDMIFSIDRPLFPIPCGTKVFCREVCDSCFASGTSWSSRRNVLTVPRPDNVLKHFACAGCRVMHYCSKECQRSAWKHHHKFECKLLGEIDERNSKRFLPAPILLHEESPVWNDTFRCMIRLLVMHRKKKLSGPEWEEITMFRERADNARKPEYMAECYGYVLKLKFETDSRLSISEMLELLYVVTRNNAQIILPLLKSGTQCFNTCMPITTIGGDCFDPFMALLNHDCDPNTWLVFEGHQARVRAKRNIYAGEELTMLYTSSEAKGDFTLCQAEQLKNWSFQCTCLLCQRGQLGLPATGPLRERILNLCKDWINPTQIVSLARTCEMESGIDAMKQVGIGYENHHMFQLHQVVLMGYYQARRYEDALKTALKLYYIVEPLQVPPLLEMDRINTLYHLVTVLLAFVVKTQGDGGMMGNYAFELYNFLREKLVSDVGRCFGEDSVIAVHETKEFENFRDVALRENPRTSELFGIRQGTPEQKQELIANTNSLLTWAGISPVTEKELF